MMSNVGTIDRAIRIAVGLIIIGGGVYYGLLLVAAIGLIPLITAFLSWCPMYLPFGFNSCSSPEVNNN